MSYRRTEDEKAEEGAGRNWRRKEIGGVEIPEEEIRRRIKERMDEYEKDFDMESTTGIDRRSIKNLASLEVRADILNDATLNPTSYTPAELDKLASTLERLLKEARLQSESLGMTRAKRMEDGGDDLATYLPHLHKEALEFIKHESIIILCEHCLAEPPRVEIRLGYILSFPSLIYHFAWEDAFWEFKTKCPRCHKEFSINSKNYTGFLYSNIDSTQIHHEDEEPHEG